MAKDFDLAAVKADIEASPFDWTAGETALTRMTEAERDHRLGVPLPSKPYLKVLTSPADPSTTCVISTCGVE